jgi:large subunit ribosomal protein L28
MSCRRAAAPPRAEVGPEGEPARVTEPGFVQRTRRWPVTTHLAVDTSRANISTPTAVGTLSSRGGIMARVCEICGKGVMVGNQISHAHNVSKRRWHPNLKDVRAKRNGGTVRVRVCTRCLRSGKIEKAIH